MRFSTALLLVAILASTIPQAALGYEVIDGHPRLYLTPDDLPAIRARCYGEMSSDFNYMKNSADSHINDSLPVAADWHLGMYSFVYLVTQDATYAERAKEIAQYIIDHGSTSDRAWVKGGSLFFDWCYDYLTPAERLTFGNGLADGGEWWMGSEHWHTMDNYHHKMSRLGEFAYYGLALYGEGIRDAAARAACDTFHLHVYGPSGNGDVHMLCCLDEAAGDGSYFEGEYNYDSNYMDFREAIELWATATDQNPFAVSGNYQNLARYYLYETGPGLIGSKQSDCHNHAISVAAFRATLHNVAKRYGDGTAKWLAGTIEDVADYWGLSYLRWKPIIWNDPTVAEVHPSTVYGDVSSALFDSVGTVYCRSGWDYSRSSNDIYAVFRCERFPAMHVHAHQNHFLIARGPDLLAVDSGVYDSWGSSHHMNYFTRTIAHNTVTVFDPNETTWGSRSNDGGQRDLRCSWGPLAHCGDLEHPANDRGRIVVYEDSADITYAKGDATASYASSKVDLFTREFLWIKPDIFVVFDRVKATSAAYDKTWLLHSINEPVISGDTAIIEEGNSRLFCKTLLPAEHAITKVGGPGHEFEVNGVNYTPHDTPPADAGAWRVEVAATAGAAEHLFLHVLYPTSADTPSMPDAHLIEAEEGMVGVEVDGHVVLFNATDAPIREVTYEYGQHQ